MKNWQLAIIMSGIYIAPNNGFWANYIIGAMWAIYAILDGYLTKETNA